jgi:ABC-2 type transport system ATP-binding protein
MSEVEAVCGRVIIIARGRIAEDQPLERLRTGSTIVLEARGPAEKVRGAIQTVPGVERVALASRDRDFAAFEVHTRDGADLREALGLRLFQNGWPLRRLDLRQVTLEERFVQAVTRASLAADKPEEAPATGPDGGAAGAEDGAKPEHEGTGATGESPEAESVADQPEAV